MGAVVQDQLRYVIYSGGGAFRRDFTVDGSADVVCNGISSAEFTLDDDDPVLPAVTADGARCAVWFRGHELFRGAITETPGVGPVGTVTGRVQSDIRKLWHWQVWPIAAADLEHQTDEFRSLSGKSEANFKTALQETLTRLGIPWAVAADHGWGTVQPIDLRFDYPGDKLLPQLDADRLVLTLTYDEAGIPTVDVRQPATVAGKLTLASGVPDSYTFNRTSPTGTRATVGGRGDGVDREFKQVIDTARETSWSDIVEIFVDAGNTDEGTDIATVGQTELDQSGPTVSVATELVETERFRFLTTYQIGDLVPVGIGPVDVTEQITQVSITTSRADGTVVTPKIGDVDSDNTDVQLARQVARLARGLRDQGRR